MSLLVYAPKSMIKELSYVCKNFLTLTFTNKLVFNLTNRLTAPKSLTDLLRTNIIHQDPTNSNITDHSLRNKHDLDVATSGSKFEDLATLR